MKSLMLAGAGIAATTLLASPVVMAQYEAKFADGAVALSGGIGVIGLEGREYVFAGAGSTDALSLLIWQSMAPVLSTSLDITLPGGWTLTGKAQAAIGGESYMEDYDWFGPFFIDFEQDNWTHRSQHPDTNLDWYVNGSMALGGDVPLGRGTTLNLNGGLKYTDVQWSARGGSFVYSGSGFRADVGSFPDEPAITYRQQLPVAFLGMDTEITADQWTFGLGGQAGVSFLAKAEDNHWMRDPAPLGLLFVDTLHIAPIASLSASAEYAFTDYARVFVAGGLDAVFLARGDTAIHDNNTGELLDTFPDAAGAELLAGSVSAGIKGTF